MLVVRRRAGESVLIGGDIEVVVLEAGQNRVKLGIMAPREVLVFRKELELTREQNRAAAVTDALSLSRLAGALSALGRRDSDSGAVEQLTDATTCDASAGDPDGR
ncbi:MAG: carbon storage regulator [Bryobacteraceae bacterium]|jgi:carbon storage regulator